MPRSPRLSIILIDWSVRESFHVLQYLSEQTADRADFEVIWIEFYDTRKAMKHKADKFIILGMPRRVYYHKHLMYNVGILEAQGEIILFCDSDAILTTRFVETILETFDRYPNIVLHLDQVRNHDRKFYPFNWPTIDDITTGRKGHNWRNGTTTGMLDDADILHTRNYGACMAAKKSDLLRIGGADEHIDYLGYICGPYDMTFRLRNAGVEEMWHESEFIYHVWHPSEGGANNYEGPHDGRKMASRAMANLKNGRIVPYVQNPSIAAGRVVQYVTAERMKEWSLSL